VVSTVFIEAAGTFLVLFTLRDVFHDIFHPTRSGSLSDFVGRIASRTLRHTRFRPAVGPLALVAVIVSWAMLLSIAFALIYFPLTAGQIVLDSSGATLSGRILHSLSLSIGSLCTFQTFVAGFRQSWITLIVALEGLIGMSMITASISWLVLVYPALERNRFLARRTFTLVKAKENCGLTRIENESLIIDMADRLIQARIDLVLFPILLHFYPRDSSQTLATALPHLRQIATDSSHPANSSQLRFAAAQLHEALSGFAQMLSERVVGAGPGSVEAVFQAFIEHVN
jgi:hypothetical protein